jgi:hypothetical protein
LEVRVSNRAGGAGAGPAAGEEIPSAAGRGADVLLDRVQLGLDVALPVAATPLAAGEFCKALVRAGFLARAPRARARRVGAAQAGAGLEMKLPIGPVSVDLPGGGSASLGGRLDLVASDAGGLHVRWTSHLLLSPMRALRSVHPSPLAAAPGGEDNLAAAYEPGAYLDLLPRQLRAVAASVDALVGALARAAGAARPLRGRVWVQQAEFCRDYPYEEDGAGTADAYIRRLRDRPIRGVRSERARFFAEQEGNRLTVSWRDGGKSSPERKAYAKRPDIVRVEVALRDRDAVAALLKRRGAPLGKPGLRGDGVAAELAVLARGAEELLDEAVASLDEGLVAAPRNGVAFVLAFAPLLRLVSPPPRAPGAAGRPRGGGVEPLARLALERLLAEGKFDMRGQPPSNPVLLALREMQAAGALAAGARQPRLFTVAPELEAARQALASAGGEPLGGEG